MLVTHLVFSRFRKRCSLSILSPLTKSARRRHACLSIAVMIEREWRPSSHLLAFSQLLLSRELVPPTRHFVACEKQSAANTTQHNRAAEGIQALPIATLTQRGRRIFCVFVEEVTADALNSTAIVHPARSALTNIHKIRWTRQRREKSSLNGL